MSEFEDRAEENFPADFGKAVPLHLLRQWLSENHDHDSDGVPVVPSMELDVWARDNAVTRVVDKKDLGGDTKDIWYFHEHGWHKAGAPCRSHITQSEARIVRVIEE